MKKFGAILLCMAMLAGIMVFTVNAAVDKTDPTDVPKIIITTKNTVNVDSYVGCTITVIDEKGGSFETITDDGASFKIRGNSTSSGEKKPFNIKFSSKTNVLGMGKNKKWCLLANCYEKTLIRNQTVLDFSKKIGLEFTPKYRVTDVYLNNRFLGSYLLTDPIEVASSRIDIDTDEFDFVLERDARTDEGTTYFSTPRCGIRLGINEPEEQTSEQYAWLMSFIGNAENELYGSNFDDVEEYFDIDSMVDFYIVLELFKNVDVNTGSTRFYIKDGKIYGGPVWDFDLSSGNCSSTYYTTYNNTRTTGRSYEGIWCQCLWFERLWKFSEFRDEVYERYLELQDDIVNIYADNINGRNYIDATVEKYNGTITRNYNEAGWDIGRVYSTLERVPNSTYERNLEYYREWMAKRNAWLLSEWELDSYLTAKKDSPYVIDGFFVEGLTEKTEASKLTACFGTGVNAFRGEIELRSADFVANGDSISCGGASYVVRVKGDTVADGVINVSDYSFIKRMYLGTVDFSPLQEKAADINGNGETDIVDYAAVKRHCLETFNIYA